jgi:Skp family chaperone for outer membrane proteins
MSIDKKIKTMETKLSELEKTLQAASDMMTSYEKEILEKEKSIQKHKRWERIWKRLFLISFICMLVLLYTSLF